MKCQRPNTDQTCEVSVSCGGRQYAEYILPPELDKHSTSPNIVKCFIPVSVGEQITVNINFSGTVLHGAADILADGAFVYDRRIEGDKTGNLKFQKRHWKLDEFYNVTDKPEEEPLSSGKAVTGGNLLVRALDDNEVPLYVKNGGKVGLGSIAVIISVNQDTTEMYTHRYQHQRIGKWRDIRADQADGGIKPIHELEFRLEDDEVHFNRQARHKRHHEQTRFGSKPWAIFVFYYRSQVAIQQADCIARPDREQSLEPFLGEFTFADPEEIKKKRLATRAKKEREKIEAAEELYDGMPDDFSASTSMSRSEGLFVSPSPSGHSILGSKLKLFGQPLVGTEAQQYETGSHDAIPQHNIPVDSRADAEAAEDWQELAGDDAIGDNIVVAQPQWNGTNVGQLQNLISNHDQGDEFGFDFHSDLQGDQLTQEIDRALQASGIEMAQAPVAAPVAKMVAPSFAQSQIASYAHQESEDVVQSVEPGHQQALQQHGPRSQRPLADDDDDDEELREPSPLSRMVSSAIQQKVNDEKAAKNARIEAKAAKKQLMPPAPKGKAIIDPAARTGYGYGYGHGAPTTQAMQQLNAQAQRNQGVLQTYLDDQSGGKHQAQPSPLSSKQYSILAPHQQTATQHAQPSQYTMSPASRVARLNMGTPNPPSPPQLMQASPHTPIPAVPRKRSASVISRASTMSKKQQTEQLSARRATLEALLAEKEKNTEAATQQLEAERRAREEMERRRDEEDRRQEERLAEEEAEVARLEAEIRRQDEAAEAVREQQRSEAEEARMRDLEWERDGAGSFGGEETED